MNNSRDWLSLLGCPREAERPPLEFRSGPSGEWLVCTVCGYGYRVDNGIPNMLPEEATAPQELEKRMNDLQGEN